MLIFIPLPLNKHPMRVEELSREVSPHMELLHSTVKARARLLELRRLERASLRSSETHASLNQAMAGSGTWGTSSFSCLAHSRTGGAKDWHPCNAPGYDAADVRTVGDNSTCWGAGAPDDNCINFAITDWNGTALLPAEPSPLHAWVHAHLGDSHSTLCNAILCLYGAFTTSVDNVKARAKPVYEGLLRQFERIDEVCAAGSGDQAHRTRARERCTGCLRRVPVRAPAINSGLGRRSRPLYGAAGAPRVRRAVRQRHASRDALVMSDEIGDERPPR